MIEARMIHTMIHLLMSFKDIPKKHKDIFEALAGMGLVHDVDIPETLTKNQTTAVVLEYVTRLYKGTGN